MKRGRGVYQDKVKRRKRKEKEKNKPEQECGEGKEEEEEEEGEGEGGGGEESLLSSEAFRFPLEYKLRDASNPGRPLSLRKKLK
jgi:hypothetical protein